MIRNKVLSMCLMAALLLAFSRPSCAGLVLGTFDSSRATTGNIANGPFAQEARNSIATHFPGSSFAISPTLTPQFLAGVSMLLIAPDKTNVEAITPLSASEQSALFNYVQAGGSAFLLVDGFSPFVPAAQSFLTPFGMTIADDGLGGVLPAHPTTQLHPVINGPFGDTTLISLFGAGVFTNLGPFAHSLATMDANPLPVLAVIEAHVLGPNSGRVVLITDVSPFIDSALGGFFPSHEALFLNSIQYLTVPEPATVSLAAVGLGVLAIVTVKKNFATNRNQLAVAALMRPKCTDWPVHNHERDILPRRSR